MIIGIGSDLANIERVDHAIAKFGMRFLKRAFAPVEIDEIESKSYYSQREYAAALAKRFAAKEAFSKALGTGFQHGVHMRDVAIVHNANGRPSLKITGGAQEYLAKVSGRHLANVHVTMTDDYPWAQAFVIIELI